MKIENMKGEFFYRALLRDMEPPVCGFFLSVNFYRTYQEARESYSDQYEVVWPVDEVDRGVIYIPTPEEFQ